MPEIKTTTAIVFTRTEWQKLQEETAKTLAPYFQAVLQDKAKDILSSINQQKDLDVDVTPVLDKVATAIGVLYRQMFAAANCPVEVVADKTHGFTFGMETNSTGQENKGAFFSFPGAALSWGEEPEETPARYGETYMLSSDSGIEGKLAFFGISEEEYKQVVEDAKLLTPAQHVEHLSVFSKFVGDTLGSPSITGSIEASKGKFAQSDEYTTWFYPLSWLFLKNIGELQQFTNQIMNPRRSELTGRNSRICYELATSFNKWFNSSLWEQALKVTNPSNGTAVTFGNNVSMTVMTDSAVGEDGLPLPGQDQSNGTAAMFLPATTPKEQQSEKDTPAE